MAGTEPWGWVTAEDLGWGWGEFPPVPNSLDGFVTGKCGLDAEAGFSLTLSSDWRWVMAVPDRKSPIPRPSWVKNPSAGSIQGHDHQTSSKSLNSQCWIWYKDGKVAGPALKCLKWTGGTMPAKSILSTITAQKNKGLLKTHEWQSEASSTQWRIKEWICPKSWNNYTGVMSNKAKCTINSFILCLWNTDSGCSPVLTPLTSHNPPRALQRLHWSLQKSIGFSCETAGGLSRVSPAGISNTALALGQSVPWDSQKLKSTTYWFLKNYVNLPIQLQHLFHTKESFC